MSDHVPALDSDTPTSKSLANHINTILSVRKNFNIALTDQRIAKALRHKVRSIETHFKEGQQVYYKREGDNKWQGPATGVGGRPLGSTYVIDHQGSLYRVSSNRLTDVEEAEGLQAGGVEKPSATNVTKVAEKTSEVK